MKHIFKPLLVICLATACLTSANTFAQLERRSVVEVSNSLLTSKTITTTKIGDPSHKDPTFNAVGNADVEATIVVNGEKVALKGRSSFHMNATQEELEEGSIELAALNLVFSGVDQKLLTYGIINPDSMGNLSFAMEGPQRVKYNPRSGVIAGELRGVVGANYMANYARPLKDMEGEDHV